MNYNILKLILLFYSSYKCGVVVSIPVSDNLKSRSAEDTVLYIEKINSNVTISKATVQFSRIQETKPEVIKSSVKNLQQQRANIAGRSTPRPLVEKAVSSNNTLVKNVKDSNGTRSSASVGSIGLANEHLETSDFQQEQPRPSSDYGDFFNFGNEEDVEISFRGPNPFIPKTTVPTLTEEDRKIRDIWGGNCLNEDWLKCNHIEGWGGNYTVKDKKNPGKVIEKYHIIPCFSKTEKVYCLGNGWTVARCHMLCMSQCNTDYRQKYDKLVQHEGECAMPIG